MTLGCSLPRVAPGFALAVLLGCCPRYFAQDKAADPIRLTVDALLKEDGYVNDVIPGSAAHKASVGPGMKLVAVNTRRFSSQVLRDALAGDGKAGGIALLLLLESGDFYHTFKLDYTGGSRYPRLERDPAGPDLLGAIVQPRAK
jgi:hypothetical protein